jgi:hypothetical protein
MLLFGDEMGNNCPHVCSPNRAKEGVGRKTKDRAVNAQPFVSVTSPNQSTIGADDALLAILMTRRRTLFGSACSAS